jgi:hypothetical protein
MATLRDIAIDANGEIVFVNGDISFVYDAQAIAQAIRIRLLFFLGEWFNDQTVGMPWFQQIFVKGTKLSTLTGLFRAMLQNTIGVNEVVSLTLNYTGNNRTLTVAWAVSTDFGQLTGATALVAGKA